MPDMDGGASEASHQTSRGPYIKTWSGRKVFLADPQPQDFAISDIARHLAGINRYTGASRFSVAQHCVVAARMAQYFYPNEKLLPARMLIHDADEAYYQDVNSPLKSLLPGYKELEERGQLAMERFFNLTFIGDPLVKEVDYRMWLTERDVLFDGRHGNKETDYLGHLEPFPMLEYPPSWSDFEEWSADEAEAEYLACCRRFFPHLFGG